LSVRTGLLKSLLPFAKPFRWVAERLARFGTDRGGMQVEAVGTDAEGMRVHAQWSLVAAAGDGPVVPTLPTVAVLRAIAGGDLPPPGARGLLPWLICRLAGLPRSGHEVAVTVAFHLDGQGGEYWRRRFARRRYASGFAAGGRGREGLLLEQFFPFQLYHRLTPRPEGLAWLLVEWRLLGIPLPR